MLMFEGTDTHVHVSATAIFEAGSLLAPGGGLDMERICTYVASRLHLVPHYRQLLAYTPIQRHPIWVDDERFDVSYHVRHAALPQPGTEAQLKQLAGEIASQALDKARPLWELWFVEGLAEDRFAILAKIHHCMVDGVSGVGVLQTLLSPTPDATIEPAPRFRPRPAPELVDFLSDGVAEGARVTSSLVRTVGDSLLRPLETAEGLLDTANAGLQTLRSGFTPTADTPLNQPIGRQRRLDWRSLDLAEIRDLRKRLDGSVNDVVLTIVAGAVRQFLKQRRVKLKGLNFRVVVPVDTRSGPLDMSVSNQVAAWFLSMPVGERNPRRRFTRIREQTRELKRTNAARGIESFLRFADWSGSTRLTFWGVNLASVVRPYNLIVTNVHGPPVRLYLLGAPLIEFAPHLPLFENQGLAVAALSYLDRVSIGVSGDRDVVPDLDAFAAAIDYSFDELRAAAQR